MSNSDTLSTRLVSTTFDTPLGKLFAVADESHLLLLAYEGRERFDAQLDKLMSRLGCEKLHELPASSSDSSLLSYLGQEIEAYFAGELTEFNTPFRLIGTDFQMSVWKQLGRIPHGKTCSYAELATKVGRPTASRAVARANATNRLSILVPCHRVIATDGSLSGYAGGVERKAKLLELEGSRSEERSLF